MSQQISTSERSDVWQITLTASPAVQPSKSSGAISEITATVKNRHNQRPAEDVLVTFSTTASPVKFSHPTVRTDHRGQASSKITYPYLAIAGGSGLIPVYAVIGNQRAALTLIFYSEKLPPVIITNIHADHIIDDKSLAAGIQAVVYPWVGIKPGNIATLFWGDESVQRAYDGENFPWVIDIAKAFSQLDLGQNGEYRVFYQASDNADNTAVCKPVEVKLCCSPAKAPVLLTPVLPL